MSSQAVAWAIVMQAGGPSAKAVLMSVANYADAYGECWQDQKTLAEGAELKERQFRTILNGLIERGLVERARRGGHGKGRQADLLRLRMRELPAIITAKRKEPEQPAISSNRQTLPEAGQPAKIAERATGNFLHGNRQLIAGTEDNPTIPTTPCSPPKGFEEVWPSWPRRDRSSKTKSAELWRRLERIHGAETLTGAVRAYLASPDARKEAGAYVPAFERWLRDKLESWIELAGRRRSTESEQAARERVFRDTGIWNPAWGDPPKEATHDR